MQLTTDTNPTQSLDAQLRFAIANKRLIQLTYHGVLRVVEPHDYGVQKGTVKVLVYQLRGPMRTGRQDVRVWRLFELPKIEGCAVLEATFRGSRGSSHQRHCVWDVLYARVA